MQNNTHLLILLMLMTILLRGCQGDAPLTRTPLLVYQWITPELNWPNNSIKQHYIDKGWYKPEDNIVHGIKLYNNSVYLTIPRLKAAVPATLTVVIDDGSQSPMLQPFPDWDFHVMDDCNSLQLVQSMEIDPNTGYMWIVDTAYIPRKPVEVASGCPAKLIIYDLNLKKEVHRHVFSKEAVGFGMFYLNDIVLDYGQDREARFAYMSDTLGRKLVVYDRKKDTAWSFVHDSMAPDPTYENITISNITTGVAPLGINGIAISAKFDFVYYSAVAGIGLYQIPTTLLRDSSATKADFAKYVRFVGNKIVQGDAMYYGKKDNLYFSTLGANAVYVWPVRNAQNVEFATQYTLCQDPRMEWVDTLGMDDSGYLWFTSNNLHRFFGDDNQDGRMNFFVWKVFVDDSSYLNITGLEVEGPVQGTLGLQISAIVLSFCCVLSIAMLF